MSLNPWTRDELVTRTPKGRCRTEGTHAHGFDQGKWEAVVLGRVQQQSQRQDRVFTSNLPDGTKRQLRPSPVRAIAQLPRDFQSPFASVDRRRKIIRPDLPQRHGVDCLDDEWPRRRITLEKSKLNRLLGLQTPGPTSRLPLPALTFEPAREISFPSSVRFRDFGSRFALRRKAHPHHLP
jgi:hypothetical protein